jgi:hypothetical protein
VAVNFRSSATTNNTVSGLVIRDAGNAAIAGPVGRLDTRLIGNTIYTQGGQGGIDLQQVGADEVGEQVTIVGNTIRNDQLSDFEGAAINLGVGNGAGSDRNRLSDVIVAYNSIEGHSGGITFLAGQIGAQRNVVERVRIIGNRVHVAPARNSSGALRNSVTVAAGDGATDEVCPGCVPVVYPDDNSVRDIEVSGNALGEGGGVFVNAACCGGARNTIQGIKIARNAIQGVGQSPGVGMSAGSAAGPAPGRLTMANRVAGVSVEHNSITIRGPGPDAGGAYGGVYVLGGDRSRDGAIRDVAISRNRIDTRMIAIHLIGGLSTSNLPASGNTVSHVAIRGNVVLRAPRRGVFVDRRATGITLTGGLGRSAARNRVTCIAIAGNRVVGARGDVAVLPTVGAASSRNIASRKRC